MRRLVLVSLVCALAAGVSAGGQLRKPAHGFQMRVDPFTVHPGQDLEVCEYRRLPNRKPIDVNGFEVRMPEGAHHFVVWSYGGTVQDDSRFPVGPVPSFGCAGVAPDEAIPQVLIPIQTPNTRFHFPPGIALRLEAHKQVLLNPHLKNPEPTDLTPDIRFNFYKARKKSVKHYAQGLIAGNTANIDVPAGGEQTLTAEWTAPVNLTLVYLATHQHRLGTYANLELVAPDGTSQMFYENYDWQHPYSYWPNPPIRLEQGRKMRITCRWQNPEDHAIRFGPKTTDEMCFILGFYYRDDGDTTPVSNEDGCFGAKSGLLCFGAPAVTP
jgi:hypothetical protein